MDTSESFAVSDTVQTALSWPEKARGIVIADQDSYDRAAALLKDIAGLAKQTKAEFEEPKKKAFDAHRSITAMEARYLAPLEEARGIISRGLTSWVTEQKRLQAKAEAEARERARREAEEKRLREAEETQRQAQERGATVEEAAEQADAVLEAPIRAVPAPVAPVFQQAKGVGTRTVWKARVTDLKALIQAVAAGKLPEDCLLPNMKRLDKMASAMEAELNCPGVEAYPETGVVVR